MKKFIFTIILFAGSLFLFSCEDEDAIRFPEFQEAANVRILVDPDFTNLKADDLANAKIVFSLFSQNTNIDEINISASYYNFQQDSNYSRRLVKTYRQSDIDAANGSIREISLTSQELASLFGIGVTDLGGGDRFDFYNVTSLTNGLVYPDTLKLPNGDFINVTPNIINSSATTSFSVGWISYVACSVPAGYATGDYLLEQIAGPDDPFFGNPTRFTSEVVTLEAVSPIERTLMTTYFTFDEMDMNFLLICGNILINHSPPLGCGLGLRWANPPVPGPYDEADDSVIIIELLENMDGDCGLPSAEPLTLRLTKVN